jgi:hypothetical protein
MDGWLRSALIGAGVLSIKALLIAAWVFLDAARTRDIRTAGRMLFVLTLLGVSGAVGGLAYAAARSRGARYYTRWLVGAEAALAGLVIQVTLVRLILVRTPRQDGADAILDFLFTQPMGLVLMAGAAGVVGLIYGRILRH